MFPKNSCPNDKFTKIPRANKLKTLLNKQSQKSNKNFITLQCNVKNLKQESRDD